MKKFFTTRRICKTAIISALYAVFTFAFAPISYGAFQCRIAEALAVLPLFFPEAIVGLSVGCLISNVIGNGLLDIILGTTATLISAILTYVSGKVAKTTVVKIITGEIPPILINAIVVPFTFLALTDLKSLYFINVLWIAVGQLIAVGVLGTMLFIALNKLKKTRPTLFE